MFLSEILSLLAEEDLLKEYIQNGEWQYPAESFPEGEIKGLTYDSSQAAPQFAFFCKGRHFKPAYLEDAISRGATVYLSENIYETPKGVTGIVVTNIREAMSLISQAFFGYPQDALRVIGVTGTKGKTTTAYFIHSILQESTHNKTALLSSMDVILDGIHPHKAHLTTPESLDLFAMMKEAVDAGMTHLVMEVSSQAYKLERVYDLHFDVGIFLNISRDHISPVEHPTFDDYFYCKRQLMKNCDIAIINRDADHAQLIIDTAKNFAEDLLTFGKDDPKADYYYESLSPEHFAFRSAKDPYQISGEYQLSIPGDFNEENAAAAILAAVLVGADPHAVSDGLLKTKVPGRMETYLDEKGTRYIVDYAHNYISIKRILEYAKIARPAGRTIMVVGSAGGKAESRRHDIAQAIAESGDIAIFTDEDSYFEPVEKILGEMKDQLVAQNPKITHFEINDRREAIQKAVAIAEPNDTVIIAGKGADPSFQLRGKEIPYETDAVVLKRLLGQMN